jgi:hypothetical protein
LWFAIVVSAATASVAFIVLLRSGVLAGIGALRTLTPIEHEPTPVQKSE